VTTAILTIGVTVDASALPVIKEATPAARVVYREGRVCRLTSAATLHLNEWNGVMVVIHADDPVTPAAGPIRVCGEATRRHQALDTMSRPRARVITPTIERTAGMEAARMVMILRGAAAMDVAGWPIWLAMSHAS
jgi:hypothetical protein